MTRGKELLSRALRTPVVLLAAAMSGFALPAPAALFAFGIGPSLVKPVEPVSGGSGLTVTWTSGTPFQITGTSGFSMVLLQPVPFVLSSSGEVDTFARTSIDIGPVTSVPEPAAPLMLVLGLGLLGIIRRGRYRRRLLGRRTEPRASVEG